MLRSVFYIIPMMVLASAAKPAAAETVNDAIDLHQEALRLYKAGSYRAAEPLFLRALTIREKAFGPEALITAESLNGLALLYSKQGKYGDAEPLFKRSLSIREKHTWPGAPLVTASLNSLAVLYIEQGRFGEAEPLLKRALENIYDVSLRDDPDLAADSAVSIINLATVYGFQGRYGEFEALTKRAVAMLEKALGPEHVDLASALGNLAFLYRDQKRYGEAEPIYKRALAILEKGLGTKHPDVAASLLDLAGLYQEQGRFGEVERLCQRAIEILENALGPEHPLMARALTILASSDRNQGRYGEAESRYQRALIIRENALGPEHPAVAESLANLARLAVARDDFEGAAEHWELAVDIVKRRTEREAYSELAFFGSEKQRYKGYVSGLVKTMQRLATAGRVDATQAASQMFETAQWRDTSEAAASLAQMVLRAAKRNPALGTRVRERQDLWAQKQATEKRLITAKSEAPDKRNVEAEKALSDQLQRMDTRLAKMDARIAKDFPDFDALAKPRPASVKAAREALKDDEALVLFFHTGDALKPLPEETFVWVVTKTETRWVRSDLGTKALQERVSALRCGLDKEGEWSWSAKRQHFYARTDLCAALSPSGLTDREPLPFDLARAHELYKGLFGEVEDVIKGKHLLIVPSGALTSLPFQVLVTAPPKPGDYINAAWLIRDHALTVLPSAASLVSLRRTNNYAPAPEPFIGFGDPVLTRKCGAPFIPDKCSEEKLEVASVDTGVIRSAGTRGETGTFFRGGLADVAKLRSEFCPLPDTGFELACVARSLGASNKSVVLGAAMTETKVKSMKLDQYRVVHFATHGLLAGQTEDLATNNAEPALVFSPPDKATEQDDGLLKASEISALKLNADWVVMSACNTAGADKPGAEALSGLAKAFFYAGARSLLVSHWPVNTYAATILTSRTFAELKREPSIGRSEAFRRAMLALMSDKDRPLAAHPSVWAPFVVVGEGGTGL